METEFNYIEILAARSLNEEILKYAQDGGAVSSILFAGFDSGILDAALVVYRDDEWHSIPGIARNKDDVLRAAGTKYIYASPIAKLREILSDKSINSIAFIGVPCAIRALKTMERAFKEVTEKVKLRICLFCTHSWDWKVMKSIIEEELKLKMSDIVKMDIKRKFLFYTQDGNVYEYPLDKAEERSRPGCKLCPDFIDRTADLAIGAIGSPKGWNTIIVLTDNGKRFVDKTLELGYIEKKEISERGLNLINKFINKKREEAEGYKKKMKK